MSAYDKFRAVMLQLHKEGIYPGPTVLNQCLRGYKSNNINGRESKWRREIMQELGIEYQRPFQTRYSK